MGEGMRPTATAQTTPFIGTLPALMNASVLALIIAATRPVSTPLPFTPAPGQRLCTTSCSSERGLTVSISEGVSRLRMVDARAFDSVPGSVDSGRRLTSRVAREGLSRAKRTSIGPERDARA